MLIFQKIETIVNNIIDKVTPDLITKYMDQLQPVAAIGLSIYLIWLVIPLFLGKSTDTAIEIMKKILIWAIIFTFAFQSGGYISKVNSSVNEVYTWAAGGKSSIYKKLDTSYEKITAIGNRLYKNDDAFVPIAGFSAMVMVLGSYYLFGFISIAFLIFAKMVLNMLLLALPLAILSILFPIIKTVFSSWIQIFLENILTVLFLNIIFNIVEGSLNTFIAKAAEIAKSKSSLNMFTLGAEIAMIMLFMLLFVVVARIMAAKLASASMNAEIISSLPSIRK